MRQNTLYAQRIKEHIKSTLSQHQGRAKAITNSALAEIIGVHDRYVQLMIRELISDGCPIASATDKPAGYFIPENWREVEDYANSLKNRLIEDAKRRRDFKKSCALHLEPAHQGKFFM